MNNPQGEGILLPAYTPRWLPVLKGIAAVTVFAFTLTCVVPPGFAQGLRRDDTLRGLTPEEAPDKAGLEDALKETVPGTVPVPGTDLTAQAEVMTRREFTWGALKKGAAATVGSSLLGLVATGELQAQELPAEARTALLSFVRARKITGIEPIMPPNIPKERLARAGQRFRGLDFNGLYREYEPGDRDAMLTRYGRIWPYGNAVVLLALLALGERKEAQELMDALVRLGKAEEALGFEGGYHFSYNTQGERLVDGEVQRDNFIHPIAPTGNTLWVVIALKRAMRELGDWRHLEWVDGLHRRVFEDIQIRDEKDLRYGFLPAARYTPVDPSPGGRGPQSVDDPSYIDTMGYFVYVRNPNVLLEDVATEHLHDAVLAAWEAYLTNEAAPKGQRGRWDAKRKERFLESYRLLVNNLPRLWVKDHFVTGIEFDPATRRLRRNDSVAADGGSWAWELLAFEEAEEMAWQQTQFNRRNFRVSLRIGDLVGLPEATQRAIRAGRIDPKSEVVGTAFWEESFMDRFIRPLVRAKDPRRAAWRWMVHPEATLGQDDFLRRYAEVTRTADRRKEVQAFSTELWRGMTQARELYGGRLPNSFWPRVDREGRPVPEPPLFSRLANITSAAWMILVGRGGLFSERSGIRLRDLPKELREGIRFEPPRGGLEEETAVPVSEPAAPAPVTELTAPLPATKPSVASPTVNFWTARVAKAPTPEPVTESAMPASAAAQPREAMGVPQALELFRSTRWQAVVDEIDESLGLRTDQGGRGGPRSPPTPTPRQLRNTAEQIADMLATEWRISTEAERGLEPVSKPEYRSARARLLDYILRRAQIQQALPDAKLPMEVGDPRPAPQDTGPGQASDLQGAGGPKLTRREALKMGAAAALALTLTGISTPEAGAQQPAPPRPPLTQPRTGPPDMLPGVLNQPNTVLAERANGTVHVSKLKEFYHPRSLAHPRKFWSAYTDQIAQRTGQAAQWAARQLDLDKPVPARDEVQRSWDPASFAPAVADVLRSYILWGPWEIEEAWWPVIFEGMAKEAGVVGAGWPATRPPHSRIYLDPYGFMSPYRPWAVEGFLRLRELARRYGVHVVPIIGDPSMGEDPDLGRILMRDFMATGVFAPDSDGIVRLALNIEPDDPEAFKVKPGDKPAVVAEKEKKEGEFWENVLKVVRSTQKYFHRRFQLPSSEDRSSVEVTLYVPSNFYDLIRNPKYNLKIPPGVRFIFMPYSNQPQEVARKASQPLQALQEDRRLPVDQQRLRGLKLGGVAVDIGPHVKPEETLFWDPARPLQGRVGDRAAEAGRQVHQALQAEPSFEREYVVHTHDILGDLVPFLRSRGPSPEEMADRKGRMNLNLFWKEVRKLLQFASGIPKKPPPARYGSQPEIEVSDERALEALYLQAQRTVAGMIASGGLAAHWMAVFETLMMSIRRGRFHLQFNEDALMIGPDLGWAYLLAKMIYSQQFGRHAKIVKVGRTFVDPSVQGETTTLPNGDVVPGYLIHSDSDILVDGTSAARRANDTLLTQLPANGYNIIWTVEVQNVNSTHFRGYVRCLPYTGYGEPIDLNSDPVELAPGERKTYKFEVTVDRDDNAAQAYGPDGVTPNETITDASERRGRLHRNVPISEGTFLVTETDVPEIAHAVGVGAFDPLALAEAARDPLRRAELQQLAERLIADHRFSELAIQALSRPLGVRVQLRADQEPEDLIRPMPPRPALADWNRPTDLRHQHGISYLVVESPELIDLVREIRNRRRQRSVANLTPDEEARLYEDLIDSWALGRPTGAERLRRLLREAQTQGLKVILQINADDAISTPAPVPVPGGAPARRGLPDPRGVQEFFSILKTVTELEPFGLDKIHSTLVENSGQLTQQELFRVVRLYANAQTPLTLPGQSGLPREIGSFKVNQAHDLTGLQDPAALAAALTQAREQELPEARREERPLGVAVLSQDQLLRARAAPNAGQLVEILIGRPRQATSDGRRPAPEGIADAQWLAEQIVEPRPSLLALNALLVDALDLKKLVPFFTGHMSTVAERLAHDPTRGFYFRYLDMDEDREEPYATEFPFFTNQFDLNQPLNVVETGLAPGPHSLRVEIVPMAGMPRLPSESQPGSLPLLELHGQPGFRVLNPGANAVSWVPVAGRKLRFSEGPPVRRNVAGRNRLMEEHRTIQFEQGGPILHLGRNRLLNRAVVWVDHAAAGAAAVAAPLAPPQEIDQTRLARLNIGGAQVTVGMDRIYGRVQIQVDAQRMDLWELVDQKAVSRWYGKVQIPAGGGTVELSTELNRRVPVLPTVRPAGVATPDLATSLPVQARDTTVEQVIGYDRRPEDTARALADGTLTVAAAAAAVRAVDMAGRTLEKAAAEVRSDHRSDLTPKPVNWWGWKGRLMGFAWITALTGFFLFLLAGFPVTGTFLAVGMAVLFTALQWFAVGIAALFVVRLLAEGKRILWPEPGDSTAWSGWKGRGVRLALLITSTALVLTGVAALFLSLPAVEAFVLGIPDWAAALEIPVLGPVLAEITAALAAHPTWTTAAKFLFWIFVVGPLLIRWIVDGVGALFPHAGNQVAKLSKLPDPLLKRLSPRIGEPIRDALAWLVGAPPLWTGYWLKRVSNLGRWVGRIILITALFVIPVSGLATQIGWPWLIEVVETVASAAKIEATAMTLGTFLFWYLPQWVASLPVSDPLVWGAVASVLGLLGIRYLGSVVWRRSVQEADVQEIQSRTEYVRQHKDEFTKPRWFDELLRGPFLRTLTAIGILATLALIFPAWIVGAAGIPTVLEALKLYVAFQALRAFSGFMAGGRLEWIGFGAVFWVTLMIGGLSWPVLISAVMLATFTGAVVHGLKIFLLRKLDPNDELGNRIDRNNWRLIHTGLTLAWAGALAWWPLRAIVMAAENPATELVPALTGLFGKFGPAIATLISSPVLYTVLAGIAGVGLILQYVPALRMKIWDPLYYRVIGFLPDWMSGISRLRTPPATPEEEKLPEGLVEGVRNWWRNGTREGITREEAEYVRTAAIDRANKTLAKFWKHLPSAQNYSRTALTWDLGLPTIDTFIAQGKTKFAEELVNGHAIQLQEARLVGSMDMGAEAMEGLTPLSIQEILRRMERSDKRVVTTNISVAPEGSPGYFAPRYHYFYGGLGVVVFPILWGSQKLQYTLAMTFRWGRGWEVPYDVMVLYGSGIHSNMENNPEAFISRVMGRWLEGHKDLVAKMVGGQLFALDPNALKPRDVMRVWRGGTEVVEELEKWKKDDPFSMALLNYLTEEDDQSYDINIFDPAVPTRLNPVAYDPDDLGDFKITNPDSGQWLIRPLKPEALYLYPPIQFKVKDGQLVRAGVGKWNMQYRDDDDDRNIGSMSKAHALTAILGNLLKRYELVPEFRRFHEDPEIRWYLRPLWKKYHPEIDKGKLKDKAEDLEEQQWRAGQQTYVQIAEHYGADGVWRGPDAAGLEERLYEDLGPRFGHEPFESLRGRFFQAGYKVVDFITGKWWANASSFEELFGREGLKTKRQLEDRKKGVFWRDFFLSLPYLLGGPWFLVAIGLIVASMLGWFTAPLWVVGGGLVLSRWILEPAWRSVHSLSYFAWRKHPISAGLHASYDPVHVLRLTRMATGEKLPPLRGTYADGQGYDFTQDTAYEQMREEGRQHLLRQVDWVPGMPRPQEGDRVTLQELVTAYARTLSREQRDEARNKPTFFWVPGWQSSRLDHWWNPLRLLEGWSQTFARRIRQEIEAAGWRPGTRKFLAVQRAILDTIRHEHLAVGNDEARYLYAGSSSPDVQTRGERNLRSELWRESPQGLRLFRVMEVHGVMEMHGDIEKRGGYAREWSWLPPNVEPVRITSRTAEEMAKADNEKEQEYWIAFHGRKLTPRLNQARTAAGAAPWEGDRAGQARNRQFFGSTHLQPDTDSVVRVAAQASQDAFRQAKLPWWLRWLKWTASQDLRYGGMMKLGPDVRHLGGFFGGLVGLLTAGVGVALQEFGLLALVGISLPTGLGLVGLFVGLFVAGFALDYVLYQIAHWLDQLGVVGRFVNRAAGAVLSLGIGWLLIQGVVGLITVNGLIASGPALAVGAIVLIAIAWVSIKAALASIFTYRWDEKTHQGWRGEGIRALSLIPGLLLQYPVVKWPYGGVVSIVRTLKGGAVGWGGVAAVTVAILLGVTSLPVLFALFILGGYLGWLVRRTLPEDVPWSWDAYLVSRWRKIPLSSFLGLVDHLEHPLVVKTAVAAGKFHGGGRAWTRRYTKLDATPVPALVAVMKEHEPSWTRVLTGLNLIRTLARMFGLGTAEDSVAMVELALEGKGEPALPAQGFINLDDEQARYEENRDDWGSVSRALQFAKGAGIWLSIQRLQEGRAAGRLVNDVMGLPPEERAKILASLAYFLDQYDQADTGSRKGAGVYAYLFTSFTAHQLAMKLVGILAPGERLALSRFLINMVRDQALEGALARQIFQMNREQPGNPLYQNGWTVFDAAAQTGRGTVARPDGTLGNLAILELLFEDQGGWAVDPRIAVGAAKSAREFGLRALEGLSEVVDLTTVFSRTVEGFFNKQDLWAVQSVARLRPVVDHLVKMGKHRVLRARADLLKEVQVTRSLPQGSARGKKQVIAERERGRERRRSRRQAWQAAHPAPPDAAAAAPATAAPAPADLNTDAGQAWLLDRLRANGVNVDHAGRITIVTRNGAITTGNNQPYTFDPERDLFQVLDAKGSIKRAGIFRPNAKIKIEGNLTIDPGVLVLDRVLLRNAEVLADLPPDAPPRPTVLEPDAQVIDSSLVGCWCAGTVRNSRLTRRAVAPGEVIQDETPDTRRARLALLVDNPDDFAPVMATSRERPDTGRWALSRVVRGEAIELFNRHLRRNPDPASGKSHLPADAYELARQQMRYRILESPISLGTGNEQWYEIAFRIIQKYYAPPYLPTVQDPFAAEKRSWDRRQVRAFAQEALLARVRALDPADRRAAKELLDELSQTAAEANLLDKQSAGAVAVFGQRGFFKRFKKNMQTVVSKKPWVDGRSELERLVLDRAPGLFVYLTDNVEEAEVDAAMWELLMKLGHRVIVAAKSGPARGDATAEDVRNIVDGWTAADGTAVPPNPILQQMQAQGRFRVIGSGSHTYGTPLDKATPEFISALTDPNLIAVIGKGQGNLYTTVARNPLKFTYVALLLSKGIDAGTVTGVKSPYEFVSAIAVVPPHQRGTEFDITGEYGFDESKSLKTLVKRNREDGTYDRMFQPGGGQQPPPAAPPTPPTAPPATPPPAGPSAGMEEAEGRVAAFLSGLRDEATQGLIPVVIGAELEAKHPEVRVLKDKGLPVLFAAGLQEHEVVIELVTRWDAREAVVAGMEQEAGRYIAILSAAGIEGRAVTPGQGNLLLEILAQAAGLEQSAIAAREGVGELMDDATVLGGQL